MTDDYCVEFHGLTKDEAFRILDTVAKTVGVFGHRLSTNGNVTIAGNPLKPTAAPQLVKSDRK